MNEVRLRVKNFGPIKDGYSDDGGFVSFHKVTLFCGPQGGGKSTITKLYSMFCWMEKQAYVSPLLTLDDPAWFKKNLAWQGIDSYLGEESEIEFQGSFLQWRYLRGEIMARRGSDAGYSKPKVLYMPADRNFASIVRKAIEVKHLPQPLTDMMVEFEHAKSFYGESYKLPANGFSFEFDGQESWIVNKTVNGENRVRLEYASSGLQSMTPLLMVADYLATNIKPDYDAARQGLLQSAETAEKKMEDERFKQSIVNSDLPEDVKMSMIYRKFSPGKCFVNVVEELEQNLYPQAQYDVLTILLTLVNQLPDNRLVLSTHSPFVVNTMVKASVASALYEKLEGSPRSELIARLSALWQKSAAVSQDDMALYELDEAGGIAKLSVEGGVFSDANKLNAFLQDWNDDFENFLSIEEEILAQ